MAICWSIFRGSPPHRRGKEVAVLVQQGEDGITPAQAGRSPYFLYGKKDYKDHPRIGGEKAELTAAVISAMGSPPRRRGKGYREFGIDISDRITPAQAGKSSGQHNASLVNKDHPRVGGEKCLFWVRFGAQTGSPPRERGKGKARNAVTHQLRITPAWAGKSMTAPGRSSRTGDHPRMGGEKSVRLFCIPSRLGSPPRGRGKEEG